MLWPKTLPLPMFSAGCAQNQQSTSECVIYCFPQMWILWKYIHVRLKVCGCTVSCYFGCSFLCSIGLCQILNLRNGFTSVNLDYSFHTRNFNSFLTPLINFQLRMFSLFFTSIQIQLQFRYSQFNSERSPVDISNK